MYKKVINLFEKYGYITHDNRAFELRFIKGDDVYCYNTFHGEIYDENEMDNKKLWVHDSILIEIEKVLNNKCRKEKINNLLNK